MRILFARGRMSFFALTCLLIAPVLAAATQARPNIIFILTDDLGWGDLGVLFQKSREAANVRSEPWHFTPNLDKMAAEGAQMPQHYCAAPVCAPSRASILLGVDQGHANVRDNQFDKALENNHTLATVLKQAGYATAAIGKYGLQGKGTNPATWPAYPTKRGFDFYFGYVRHRDGHEHYPKEGLYRGKKEVWSNDTEMSSQLDKCYTADLWTARAKKWIMDHQRTNSAQPFFIYLAYDTPHAVLELPTQAYPAGGGIHGGLQWLGTPGHMINTASGKIDSYVHPDYATNTWDNDRDAATPEVPWPDVYKRYATCVRRIDNCVGDLIQLLKDLKLDKNTFIVFTSDNGPSRESYLPEHYNPDFFNSFGPFDGIKRDCWEGGVRMPTLARWPGKIPAGSVVNRPSGSWDWLPTFADLAGVPAPARADGVSLLPELTGVGTQRDRGFLYIEYYHNGTTPDYSDFAPSHRGRRRKQMQVLRMGDLLGVRYNITSQKDDFEIYNVVRDPKETNNLAATMPALEQKMKDKVLQVRRPNSSAPRPYDNELVPAVTESVTDAGVEWKAYEGAFPWVPDLEALTPVANGVSARPDLGVRPRDNNIGMLFTGYLNTPADGDYTFYLRADTGALLRIHDATVIDADYGYVPGEEISAQIKLKAGLHPFRLFYARRTHGTPLLELSWSGPHFAKQPVPGSAFRRSTRAK